MNKLEDEILFCNAQSKDDYHQGTPSFPVHLIVVDSIAVPTKRDLGGGNHGTYSAPQRVAAILQCAQMLKRLASQLELAVVVINQASPIFQPTATGNRMAIANSHQGNISGVPQARAALGTAWHHCVSTRLLMDFSSTMTNTEQDVTTMPGEQQRECPGDNSQTGVRSRMSSVVKSNMVGYSKVNYKVTDCGTVETTL